MTYIDCIKKYIEINHLQLHNIFIDCWKGMSEKNEIPRLKEFLTKENVGISFINNELKGLKNKYFTIQLNSVFSHGSPKVNFDYKNKNYTRELADLLVIYRINDGHFSKKNICSKSFLSQWKLNKRDNKNIGQQYLYDSVDTFKVPQWLSNQNNGRQRCFGKKENALNFFYLDNNVFLKRPNGDNDLSFSSIMMNLLEFDYGLQFDNSIWNNNSSNNYEGWNELMYDLIVGIGRKTIPGTEDKKLLHFFMGDEDYKLQVNNESNKSENEFQSTLIVDINFNLRIKLEEVMNYHK